VMRHIAPGRGMTAGGVAPPSIVWGCRVLRGLRPTEPEAASSTFAPARATI